MVMVSFYVPSGHEAMTGGPLHLYSGFMFPILMPCFLFSFLM